MRKQIISYLCIVVLFAGVFGGCSKTEREKAGNLLSNLTEAGLKDKAEETSETGELTDNPDELAVRVATLEEFVTAIEPGAIIVVPESGLTLSIPAYGAGAYEQGNEGETGIDPTVEGKYTHWELRGDFYELIIHDVDNLTIQGEGGEGLLLSLEPYAWVLSFDNCDNLTVESLIAGHDVEGYCNGGVFHIKDSRRIEISNVRMYGCGTEGLLLSNVEDVIVQASEIYDCTFNLMTIDDSSNIVFKDTVFRDTGEFDMIYIYESNGILFDGCIFKNNFRDPYAYTQALFSSDGRSWDVRAENCTFTGNRLDKLDKTGFVEFIDCEFKGNMFDRSGYFDEYNKWRAYSPEDGVFSVFGSETENNGGQYVMYDGATYFRQYSKSNFAGSARWDEFLPVPGAKSAMVRLSDDGTMDKIFTDNGYGPIFIYRESYDDASFVLNREYEGEDGEIVREIYSVGLDGTGEIIYGSGSVFAVDENMGTIIASTPQGGIYEINFVTGKWTEMVQSGHVPLYYDLYENMLYCEDNSGYGWYSTFCSIDMVTGHKATLFGESMAGAAEVLGEDEYGWCKYINTRPYEDVVQVYLAKYGGTAKMLGEAALLRLNKDGSGFTVEKNTAIGDWFGQWTPFSFQDESPFQEDQEHMNKTGYWMFTDGLGLTELISKSDLAKIGLADGEYFGEDDFVVLQHVEFVGENLFFTVVTGTRNPSEDIGWRFAYNLGRSRVYKMDVYWAGENLVPGDITLLYSY